MSDKNAVWLIIICGCSKGVGRVLAEQALAADYRVVAAARRAGDVADLRAAHPEAVEPVALDVTDQAQTSPKRFLGYVGHGI